MNHIGNVIKDHRNMLHMSRKALSENICSDKYLYLIEKGERTPSSEITRLLGDRMGVDLFKYHLYLDCVNPIQICYYIEKFYKSRRENDLVSLMELTEEAKQIPDFGKEPWIYEIELNYLMIQVLGKEDFVNSIPSIQKIITQINKKRIYDVCLAFYYVLLSTCYQMARDIKSTREVIMLANKTIEGKEKIAKYIQVIVTVKINIITMHYLAGELEEVIEESLKLLQYQNEMCYHSFLHHTLFYLAYANYQIGSEEEGIEWFQKALSLMIVQHRDKDMYYLTSYEIFDVIIRDERVPKDLVKKIQSVYSGIKI